MTERQWIALAIIFIIGVTTLAGLILRKRRGRPGDEHLRVDLFERDQPDK